MKSAVRIGVVGAGRMGIGIAQVFAYAGYPVELIDVKDRSEEESSRVLEDAKRQIRNSLLFLSTLGLLNERAVRSVEERIGYHSQGAIASALRQTDVVFEAVPEVMEIKRDAIARMNAAVRPDTMIASTTSTFLVNALAEYVKGPERFLNTHWLNPAYLIPLVEVSPGEKTDPEITRNMLSLLEEAGKVPVTCAPSPGFIVPRIQALAMNEAARIVQEGVASAEDVDKASRVGFGVRFAVLGLLEFIDWGGGDILYYADRYLQGALGSDRFAPPSVIEENMSTGKIGMKTGEGFYDFTNRDLNAYQQETLRKFVDLLRHLNLLPKPGEDFA